MNNQEAKDFFYELTKTVETLGIEKGLKFDGLSEELKSDPKYHDIISELVAKGFEPENKKTLVECFKLFFKLLPDENKKN